MISPEQFDKDTENVIASVATLTVYNFYKSKEAALAALPDVKAKCIEDAKMCASNHVKYDHCDQAYWLKQAGKYMLQCNTYQVMTWTEYKQAESDKRLSVPITEITEEQYYEALNVLPPVKYGTNRGVKSFFMSEMYSGSYTEQYAEMQGKYWCKLVDLHRPETWIQPEMITTPVK